MPNYPIARSESLPRLHASLLLAAFSAALLLLAGCGLGNAGSAASGSQSVLPVTPQAISVSGQAYGGLQAISKGKVQLYQVGVGSVAGASGYTANAIPLISTTVTTSDGSATTINAWSLDATGLIGTFTATNSYAVSNTVTLNGFTGASNTFLNGQTVTVTSASGSSFTGTLSTGGTANASNTATGYGNISSDTNGNAGNNYNALPAGSFTITGDYSCATGSEVYLTIAGGSSDGGADINPSIALVAALGSCATLKANAGTAYVYANEVSTVAAAYALAQFAKTTNFGTTLSAQPGVSGTSAPADNIATSPSNTQGLINAMASATVLANSFSLTGTPTGKSPGSNSNASATAEYWTVNTIADILSTCVNTANGGTTGDGTLCGKLFTYTTPTGGTAPADTFQAALQLALHPGDATILSNTSLLDGLITSSAPYQPYVNTSVANNSINDWTIAVSYNPVAAGSTTKTLLNGPYDVAADSNGNIWVMSSAISAGRLTELDPTGNPYFANAGKTACSGSSCAVSDYDITTYLVGTTSTSIGQSNAGVNPTGFALDPSNNVWVMDRSSNKNAIFKIIGSTLGNVYNGGGASSSTPATGYSLTSIGNTPVGVAVDGNGTPWFTLLATGTICGSALPFTGSNQQALGSLQGTTPTLGGSGGGSGATLAVDAGNPSCTPSTTSLCNQTVYDKLSGATTVGSVSITAGGSSYTSGFSVSFSGGGGTGAAGTAVVSGGVVTGVTITNAGSGYTSAPTVNLTGGGGTGATGTVVLGTIANSPFLWAPYNAGQGTTLAVNSSNVLASTLGHYYTGTSGCGTPLNSLGSGNVAASAETPTTVIPSINPSGSDQIEYFARSRGFAIGQGGTLWSTNGGPPDANATITGSISKLTPNYGSALTTTSFLGATAAFKNYTGGGLSSIPTPEAVVIDGSGGPWVAGATATGTARIPVAQFDINGNALSPSTGYLGTSTATLSRVTGSGAYYMAIDESGNVWIPDGDNGNNDASSGGGSGLTSTSINTLIGAATPVVAPLSLGAKNGTLGMEP